MAGRAYWLRVFFIWWAKRNKICDWISAASLDNTIDRDGEGMKSAELQAVQDDIAHFWVCGLTGQLWSNKYTNPGLFPKPSDYPYDLKLYNIPILPVICQKRFTMQKFLGRNASFMGIWPWQTNLFRPNWFKTLISDKVIWNLLLLKQRIAMESSVQTTIDVCFLSNKGAPSPVGNWPIFKMTMIVQCNIRKCLYGMNHPRCLRQVIGILRKWNGAKQKSPLIRGGVNGTHGMMIRWLLSFTQKGWELTGDFGYNIRSPDHRGFGSRVNFT